MKKVKFNFKDGDLIFRNLSQDYKIFAPVKKNNKGRLSDTGLITYDYINSFEEIDFLQKTYYSPKEILFPIRQAFFEFKDNEMIEVKEDAPNAIVFLRSCDIHAIKVTDEHFLKSGFEDIYYKRRRQKLKFFLIECSVPFESCFCVSQGTNRTEDYAVFIRKTQDGFEVKINNSEMERFFEGYPEIDVEPKFPEKDQNPINMPENIDASLFKNEMWQEYSRRCIGCGRCNASCPTCTCWTMQDILPKEKEDIGKRRRIWSSCQVKKFSTLAGQHDFRIPYGDRMRYKVLHKIRDFKKKAGFNMCVGCGRCDDVCPEYISMFKCIQKINSIIEKEAKDG